MLAAAEKDTLPSFARFDAVAGFFSVWNAWRGDALTPTRAQVKTGEVAGLMRSMMLIDVHAPEKMIFRYAGSIYQEVFGFEFTGLNYLDITEPEARPTRSKRLWDTAMQPAASVWTIPSIEAVDFIGATVPISPDDPSDVMKLMQVIIPLKDIATISAAEWRKKRTNVYFSDRFRYIDIGAGKPDTSMEA
jgi:hypothetical protein